MQPGGGVETSVGVIDYTPGATKVASRTSLTAGLSLFQTVRARFTRHWYGVAAVAVCARWTMHRKSGPFRAIVARRT